MIFKLTSLVFLIFCVTEFVAASRRIRLTDPERQPQWMKVQNYSIYQQGPFYGQPEQVHLSYGGSPGFMIVTWLTFDDPLRTIVEYGVEYSNLNQTTFGTIDYFVDGGSLQIKRYTHRVILDKIESGKRYFYRVGSEFGWSSIYSFVGLKERPDGGYRYAVYGDMGNINARSLGKLQRMAQKGDFDVVLHVGDMAYDLDTDNGKFGDEFMRQIEPIAAYLPYMTVVGNHEEEYNFTHYVNRFTMPNTKHNLFYSFDLGDAHFIAFSTEFYYFYWSYGFAPLINQWNWLIRDLEIANQNRKNIPWIITMGHRPMYCSALMGDCDIYDSVIRTGLPIVHKYGLEKLFYDYGVDLALWAHEHNYERMYPVFNRTVFNGTQFDPYTNPPAPVHIITGSAGCQENTDIFIDRPGPWSAFRSSKYGFSQMHIFNTTHLYFEQLNAVDNSVEDHVWLIKSRHAPYTKLDKKRLKKYGVYVPKDYCHNERDCEIRRQKYDVEEKLFF